MSLKATLKKLNPLKPSTPPPGQFIFPQTTPEIDGEECIHDCETCTTHLPKKWSIDEEDALYGHIDGWNRHIIVATGKTDWVRDVADEKGSVMEAVGAWKESTENGKKAERLKLSASNIPLPDHHDDDMSTEDSIKEQQQKGTTCLLLPAFTLLEHVTPTSVPELLNSEYFQQGPTNVSEMAPSMTLDPSSLPKGVTARACPHDYLILLCSQKTRDARCGQSAPLLKREFQRCLRPLGMDRDLDDDRPGGVGVYFISHVGGHKYSANVLIYRSTKVAAKRSKADGGAEANGDVEATKQAMQCIWLARVRPEDCENIIRYTVLQGKVVKPQRQLRGGFDREKGVTSW